MCMEQQWDDCWDKGKIEKNESHLKLTIVKPKSPR
jgi:hypothetical protein